MTDAMEDSKPEPTAERITLHAEISQGAGRALDPQSHDGAQAREIAIDLCDELTRSYRKHDGVRPETLAVAVQTVLETLLGGVEREGVDSASMRVALANSLLVNGAARVTIDIDGKRVPTRLGKANRTLH